MSALTAPAEQLRRRSLARGQHIRMARVAITEKMRAGQLDPAAIVRDPPWYAQGMTVLAFLDACPGVGPSRIRRFNLRAAKSNVNLLAPLDELTDRQRDWLIEQLPRLLRPHAQGR